MSEGKTASIQEKFHDSGDLFALRFNSGLVFLEVVGWEQTKYAPYDNIGTVDAKSGSGYQRLEHDNDDILYTDRRKKKVKHLSIGQSPAYIRRYTNYPEDETRLRTLENLGTVNTGANFGYIDGEDSPYADPTEAGELYVPPGVHLNFDFYNPDSEPHEPVLNIEMREYNVRPLDPRKSKNKNAIKRILSTGSPMPIAPVGSIDNQVRYELESHWNVKAMTDEEVRNMVGGV